MGGTVALIDGLRCFFADISAKNLLQIILSSCILCLFNHKFLKKENFQYLINLGPYRIIFSIMNPFEGFELPLDLGLVF